MKVVKGQMGLFSNKENPYLPVSKNREYLEYSLPSSSVLLMANLSWLETCIKNSKNGKAIWKVDYPITTAKLIVLEDSRFLSLINVRIEGVASLILQKIEEKENKQNLELVNSQLSLGGALALIEEKSGLQIQGLVHPSIHNAICFTRMTEKIDNQNLAFGAEKAIEVGYGLVRYTGEKVDRFINNLRKLQE